MKKEWLAAMDGRTRSSHRHLDGVSVGVDEKFPNGCRYPGDPQGAYAETCNCRCTLVAAIDGVDTSDAERWSRLPEGTTYGEWRGEPPKPDLSKYIGDGYGPFDTITRRQGGYIFAAWKRGALDAEKEQMDLMYGRYVSEGPSRPSTDAKAVGVASKLRTCINAIAANDKPAAAYAFEQFVDAHYMSYSDSRYPDVRGRTREKHALKSGRYAYSQEEIDEVMERRGIRLNTVVPITYNPRLGTPGVTRCQILFPGFYHVTSIEIGPQKNGEENELIDSILHEVLESKLLARGDKLLEGGDKTVHPYIDKIIARYAKMKGLW